MYVRSYVSVVYMYFKDSANGWIVIYYECVVHSCAQFVDSGWVGIIEVDGLTAYEQGERTCPFDHKVEHTSHACMLDRLMLFLQVWRSQRRFQNTPQASARCLPNEMVCIILILIIIITIGLYLICSFLAILFHDSFFVIFLNASRNRHKIL